MSYTLDRFPAECHRTLAADSGLEGRERLRALLGGGCIYKAPATRSPQETGIRLLRAWVVTMKILSQHCDGETSGVIASAAAISSTPNQVFNRRGFFANLVEALHESRRCQAMREIHRYQHLVHYAREFVAPHEVQTIMPRSACREREP